MTMPYEKRESNELSNAVKNLIPGQQCPHLSFTV